MQRIKLYRLENWLAVAKKPEHAVIYSSPCEMLLDLQEQGYCVLAELSHLQGLSDEKAADALSEETAVVQYRNVCICAAELPQAYLCRIWCRTKGLPVTIAETDRLVIRESVPEDGEAFRQLYQEEDCKRFLEAIPVKQYKQYIEEYKDAQYAFFEYGMWTVLEKKSGAVIGRMGLEQLSDRVQQETVEKNALSLGYALLPQYRGLGYAMEACQAILSYCRECEYTEHIVIIVDRENTLSIKLAQRLQTENRTGINVQLIIK